LPNRSRDATQTAAVSSKVICEVGARLAREIRYRNTNPPYLKSLSRAGGQTTWCQDLIDHTTISKYELDKNEPPLALSCSPIRASQEFPLERTIDDELDLTI
jgi:hypothetical protein